MSSSAGVPCTLLLHRTRSRALSYAVRAPPGNHAGGGMAAAAGPRGASRVAAGGRSCAVQGRAGNEAGGGRGVAAGRRDAFRFVVVMGTVSLFADFTYEGA